MGLTTRSSDRFISLYAPTVRLLRQIRQRTAPRTGEPRPLIVALPATPGQSDLPAADQEANAFVGRFPSATQLRGPQATTEAVERALADWPQWAHFACHGVQNVSDPSAGHLLLHDGPLSIGEISRLRLNRAELAFLSACETFRGGAELADEAITLATAFQLAGYRHVIGTLWTISDKLAPDVADHVYEALTTLTQPDSRGINASNTAVALDSAVLALRQKRPSVPWLWAAYAHIGP